MRNVVPFKKKPPHITPDQFQKVVLPGESVWVKVIEISPHGILTGEISNNVFSTDRHSYRLGDIVRFAWVESPSGSDLWCWLPIFEAALSKVAQ